MGSKMTLDEALALFAAHGNVSSDIEELRRNKPRLNDLHAAAEVAIRRGVDKDIANAARHALIAAGHFIS